MTLLADLLSTVFDRRYRRDMPQIVEDDRPLTDLAGALLETTSESSEIAMARQVLRRFAELSDADKFAFFKDIATTMNIDPEEVRSRLDEYEADPTRDSYRAFIQAAEPARQELIRRLNRVPGATGALVRMRADLLRLGREDPDLQALDLDFRHLLASWFNRGFLVLRPINWESPAHILEKIIAYEAVHAIDSWSELRRRLEPSDRRCFAFFHPSMPDEPLIFVEVALTSGTPGSVQGLLTEERQTIPVADANTAVFYSISNCQAGLASISFGNSLIKQVAADLSAELPDLNQFVTLSPIPGLTRWMRQADVVPQSEEPEALCAIAAHYLLNAKNAKDLPFDPVARFHLGNGAIVHEVHADADTSAKGREQSMGVMVNYLYDLKKVEQNHEEFVATGRVIAAGDVRALADQSKFSDSSERQSHE